MGAGDDQKRTGVILVELIIGVALIGILFAIMRPKYQNYQTRGKAAEALSFLYERPACACILLLRQEYVAP